MNKIIPILFILASILLAQTGFGQSPVMTSPPTAGTITNTNAILGGNIISSATAVTDRGFIFKTSSPVLVTDTKSPATVATGIGSFSLSPSLSAATQYFMVSYGTNTVGTSISTEISFYTLSNPPTGQPSGGTFTATTVSETRIDLAFTAPNTVSIGAAGYAIYRIDGATITGLSLTNGAVPPPTIGLAVLVGTTASADVSFSDTGVIAGKQYSYALIPFGYDGVNAATYNYLVPAYVSTVGYTFSTVPDNQPSAASVSATAISPTQIDLAFPTFSGLGNANGYVILRDANPGPALTSVQDGVAPASLSLGTAILVATITSNLTTTINDTGLTPNTTYYYAVVPFNWDTTNPQTYNYKTGTPFTIKSATTFNATSTITLNGGTTTDINYIDFPTLGGTLIRGTNNVSLGKFRITDIGGDGAPTTLTAVTISISNNSNVSEIAIFDSGNNNRAQVTNPGASATFSSLTGISASNSGTNDFEFWATFKNSVIDQQIITLTITAATTSGTGLASFAATTGPTENKIKVSSNQFSFSVSGVPVTSLPNTAPNANFAPLTVTAVDANGNIQLNRSNTVTLSLFSGNGTLNGVPGLVQNLSGGTTTFPNLSITAAGAKTIRATYGISGVSAGNININITTPGVLVTAGTVAAMCYSGDYQSISPITIEERDPSDFTTGGTFSLALPSGFEFNQGISTAPTISGNEINTISALSYPSVNTVQFSYSISGTSNSTLDKIIINGLQVNYTGTSPASGNLVRFGGSAIQSGNTSSDVKNHCTLTSGPSATVVTFGVQAIGTDPAIPINQDRFSVTAADVQLVGTPAGGVFTGSAVTFSVANGYRFSPSSVGVGTYTINYTYTEPIAPRCKITITSTFTVVANIITNLFSSYCTTSPPSTNLSISPATVNQIGFIYTFYFGWTLTFQDFVYRDNFSGLDFPLPQVAGQYVFDPSDPIYKFNIENYGNVRIGVKVTNQFGTQFVLQYVNVRVFIAPKLTLDLPASICSNTSPINLITLVTPVPSNFATDKFSGTSVVNPSTSVASFNPTTVPGGNTTPTPVNILYQYTDPNPATGGCSNTVVKQIIVNPVPSAPALGTTNSPISVCQNSLATPLTATPQANTTYSWYSNISLGVANRLSQGNSFTPNNILLNGNTFNNTIVDNYQFFLTQTQNGCESVATAVQADVVPTPTLSILNPSISICDGPTQTADISQSSVGATLGGGALQATWSGGLGTYAGGNKNLFAPNVATTYQPSASERLSTGQVILTLTSDRPNLACPAAVRQFTISIKKTPDPPVFLKVGNGLPDGATLEYCDDNIDPKIVAAGAGTGTGSISFYKNSLSTILSLDVADNPSNPAFVNYNFNPSSERSVSFLITQTTDKALPVFAGCTSGSRTLNVLLHPLPDPNFSISNLCYDKLIPQPPTKFTDTTPPLNQTSDGPSAPYSPFTYKWDFGENANGTEASQQNPVHTYSDAKSFNTKVTITTNKGCTKTSSSTTIEIGPIPQPNFTFEQLCKGDLTKFTYDAGSEFNNSTNGRTIDPLSGWSWTFGDPASGSNTSSLPNPTHTFSGVGLFNASLVLKSKLGCQNTKANQVYILPTIKFDINNVYNESFENNTNAPNNGGWATEVFQVNGNKSSSVTSWNLLTPNGSTISAASKGTKAWVAGLQGTTEKTYNVTNIVLNPDPLQPPTVAKDETSVLNTPCFDISSLNKPVISFDYIVDTYARNDGVYVQSSIDNGITWKTFGQLGKGVSWYNNAFIIGLSGSGNIGQAIGQEGWDGDGTGPSVKNNSPGWNTGRYTLSALGSNKFRLRFFFGAGNRVDGSYYPLFHNGFGLDNVVVENSNRTVLAENFINNAAAGSAKVNTDFIGFKKTTSQLSLVKIQYHTSFGGADAFNALNPADPQARAAFYGVTSSFKGFIDSQSNGLLASAPINTPSTWGDDLYDERALTPSPLIITFTPPFIPPSSDSTTFVKIKADIKIGGTNLPIGNGRYLIQMAIVEDVSGEPVLRKLLPNAAGKLLTAVTNGATQTVSYLWQSSAPINPAKLSAICFVQDLLTREILQAASAPMPTTTVVTGIEPLTESDISIFPNPANQEFTLQLPKIASQKVAVKLIDQLGKEINTYSIGLGEKEQTISTRDLAGAIYILQIETVQGIVRKKVMVAH